MSKDLRQIYQEVNEIIDAWYEADGTTPDVVQRYRRRLSALYYYLIAERSKAHKKWIASRFKHIQEDMSNAKAEANADIEVPELYFLRHIATAIKENLNAMGSEIKIALDEKREAENE